MYFIIKTLILALVEAFTEFLPISSTGHLIIVGKFLAMPDTNFSKFYNIIIQLAAILAVMFHYRSELKEIVRSLLSYRRQANDKWTPFVIKVIIASMPAAILGLLFHDFIEEKLFSVYSVSIALFLGGLLMIFAEKKASIKAKEKDIEELSWRSALFSGFFQCLALIPGMSRSASSIIGAWFGGMQTGLATKFSFYMAMPIMCGASFYSLLKFILRQKNSLGSIFTSQELIALILSFALCFIVSLFVVRAFLHFLSKKGLRFFAYYRLILAVILLFLLLK